MMINFPTIKSNSNYLAGKQSDFRFLRARTTNKLNSGKFFNTSPSLSSSLMLSGFYLQSTKFEKKEVK